MSAYDSFADQYRNMLKHGTVRTLHQYIVDQLELENGLSEKAVCDLGCGQGQLAFDLSQRGAKVTGVDVSKKQLEYASSLTEKICWVYGDATNLEQFQDESFDIVTSSVMLMDLADHNAVFKESYRVLKPGGTMIWLVMHPCFHSPFCTLEEDGSRMVSQYTPQYWKSKGNGTLRSILGSHHRSISQYVNDFMQAGFSLNRLLEPGYEAEPPSDLPVSATTSMPNHFGAIGKKSAA